MKSLIAFSCLLAFAVAKPDNLARYGSHLFTPASYSYSTYLAGSPVARWAPPVPLAHSTIAHIIPETSVAFEKTQYHSQDELGQASYGHSEAMQSHNAIQDAAGNKMGSYSYIAPDGQVISTNYIADNLGFRVATNALPIGPSALPLAPLETPEVQAARAAHFKAHEMARSRSRRSVAIETPIAYSGLDIALPIAPVVQPSTIPLLPTAPLTTLTPHTLM